jgi:RNA polymerase sigma factor (sigma-70 family)
VADGYGSRYADDLYSIFLETTLDALSKYDGSTKIHSYLKRCYMYAARDFFRKEKKPVVCLDEVLENEDGEVGYDSIEEGVYIRMALEKLPEEQKKICYLLGQGFSYRQIAEMLGTYPMKIARHVKQIRDHLSKELYAA